MLRIAGNKSAYPKREKRFVYIEFNMRELSEPASVIAKYKNLLNSTTIHVAPASSRPNTNLGTKQGDHVTAYALIAQLVVELVSRYQRSKTAEKDVASEMVSMDVLGNIEKIVRKQIEIGLEFNLLDLNQFNGLYSNLRVTYQALKSKTIAEVRAIIKGNPLGYSNEEMNKVRSQVERLLKASREITDPTKETLAELLSKVNPRENNPELERRIQAQKALITLHINDLNDKLVVEIFGHYLAWQNQSMYSTFRRTGDDDSSPDYTPEGSVAESEDIDDDNSSVEYYEQDTESVTTNAGYTGELNTSSVPLNPSVSKSLNYLVNLEKSYQAGKSTNTTVTYSATVLKEIATNIANLFDYKVEHEYDNLVQASQNTTETALNDGDCSNDLRVLCFVLVKHLYLAVNAFQFLTEAIPDFPDNIAAKVIELVFETWFSANGDQEVVSLQQKYGSLRGDIKSVDDMKKCILDCLCYHIIPGITDHNPNPNTTVQLRLN